MNKENLKLKTEIIILTIVFFIMHYVLYCGAGDILIHTRDETDGYITGATVKVYQHPTDPRVTSVPCGALPSTAVVSKTGAGNENFVRFIKGTDFVTDPDPSPTIPNGSKLTFVIERDGFVSQCIDNNGAGYVYSNSCDPDSSSSFGDCQSEQKSNLVFSVRIEVIKRADGNIGINTPDGTTSAVVNLTNIKFYDVITGNDVTPTDDNGSTIANVPRLCRTNKIATKGDDCTVTPKFLVPVPFGTGASKTFRIFISGYKRAQASLSTTASFGQTKVVVKFDNACSSTPTVGCGPSLEFSTILDRLETEIGLLIGIGTADAITGHISDGMTTIFMPVEGDTFNGTPYLDPVSKRWLLPITSNFSAPSRSLNIRINGFAESGNTAINSTLFTSPDTVITWNFAQPCSVNICSAPLKYAARVRINNIEGTILPSDLNLNLTTSNTFTSLTSLTLNGSVQYGQCSADTGGTSNCAYIPVKDYLGQNVTFDADITIDGFTKARYTFVAINTFTQQNFSSSSAPPKFVAKLDKIKDELGKGFKILGNCPAVVSPCNADITNATFTVTGSPVGDFSIVKTLIQSDRVLIAISGTKNLHQIGGPINGSIVIKVTGFVGSNASFNGVNTGNFNLNLDSQIDIQLGINGCTANTTTICAESQKYKLKFNKMFAKALPNCTPNPQDVSGQINSIPANSFTISSNLTQNGTLQTGVSDTFYYLPLQDDGNDTTSEILSIGKNNGILLNLCNQTNVRYAGIDIDISSTFNTTNLSKQFEIQIAPTGNCLGTNIVCTNTFLTFNALKIITKDETAGKITGSKVSIYKGATGLCASLPQNPDKIMIDGTQSDSDGVVNGEILAILPGFVNSDKLTIVIEKDGFVKRCDDNGGSGFSFSSGADASNCSDPSQHNTNNCFFEYLKFNVVITIVKRNDNKKIGIVDADSETKAKIDSNNTKIFGTEGDDGSGLIITADGETTTANQPRFCSDNNSNIPVNNIGSDCTVNKYVFIPLKSTTKKFSILIAGYTQKEIDLSSNTNIGTNQIRLVFSDNSSDCSGATCVNALQTSIVIDKIEDELANSIGIGTNGTIGSISNLQNTIFTNFNTQLNGNPYIATNKWFVPSISNLVDNSFKMLIDGFDEKDTGTLLASTYTLATPQKTIRFVKDTSNITNCPTNSATIKCVSGFKFACLIKINNIEGNLKPSDINFSIDITNVFIKAVKNGIELVPSNFNATNKGILGKCSGETSQTTNCLYISVMNFLGQNQSMIINLTIDGFTKVTYNFNATSLTIQQEPASNSGNISAVLKIEKIKDELDKFFKINGTCNFGPNCNNSDVNSNTISISSTQTAGPPGNFTILKTYFSSGKIFIALKGTKAISENEISPLTITGKIGLQIIGFLGQNAKNIEISNVTLSNATQKELKFGFSDIGECPPSSITILCSPLKFKYKLKLTKIIAQDNVTPSNLQDVTTQIGNLIGKIDSENGASLNGIYKNGNLLYIGVYDTTFNTNGTNNNTGETLRIGIPFVQFTLNSLTTTYNPVITNISQIFFDTNALTQFTLEIAPASGINKCSGNTNSLCANSFFTVARFSITNMQIIAPINGIGLGGTDFVIKFKFTDKNNSLPDSVYITIDSDSSLSISSLDLIKEQLCNLREDDPFDNNTTDGKDYFCTINLIFISDGTNKGFIKGRFILKAIVGNFTTIGISSLNQTLTVLDNPPQLSENSVTPPFGNKNTTFEFKVRYKDKEGNPPSFIELLADLNGNNVIESNEVFPMAKENINDDNFIIFGVVYKVALKPGQTPQGNILKYAFRAGDGFIDNNAKTIQTTLPTNFNINNISEGTFLELQVSSSTIPPTIDWAGNLGITGFEENKFGLGFIEPDSGNSGDNFTFLVVYTSVDNIPAQSAKILYKDKFGSRSLPLSVLTKNTISQLPTSIKNIVQTKQNLFDGNFENGELYYAVYPLYNSDITIRGIEISDGNFVISRIDFNSIVKLDVNDNDNDGVDDQQEGFNNAGTNTKIALNALDDPPLSTAKYTFTTSVNAVFAPPPQNPFFTSITAPGNLEEGVLGSGKLPSPLGIENSKLLALFQLGVRLISGDSVTFTVELPYQLPTNAKIFKLGRNNIWHDITNKIYDLSADRKIFKFDVENNNLLDKDSDFFGSADPGGFKFIVDPIAIFAPQMPSLPPQTSVGGGGCFIHPKKINGNDSIMIFVLLLPLIFLIIARFTDQKAKVKN